MAASWYEKSDNFLIEMSRWIFGMDVNRNEEAHYWFHMGVLTGAIIGIVFFLVIFYLIYRSRKLAKQAEELENQYIDATKNNMKINFDEADTKIITA